MTTTPQTLLTGARCLTVTALTLLLAHPATAHDDDLTAREISEIRASLNDIGCYGGDYDKKRNGTYEVDDARCPDGEEYEFRLSSSFEIIRGKRD